MIPADVILNHFPDLREKGLKDAFSEHCIFKSIPAQTVILKESDTVRYLPLLLKGSLKVTRADKTGREVLLYYIRSGESCIASYAAALFHELSKVNAMTEEDSEIILMPVEFMESWIREYPSWNIFVIRLYYQRFEELLDTFNSMAFQKVDQRLAEYLMKKSLISDVDQLSVTHQQIADELGTAREVVSRLLKAWEVEGKVSLSRGMIKIMKPL